MNDSRKLTGHAAEAAYALYQLSYCPMRAATSLRAVVEQAGLEPATSGVTVLCMLCLWGRGSFKAKADEAKGRRASWRCDVADVYSVDDVTNLVALPAELLLHVGAGRSRTGDPQVGILCTHCL